ncbi:MAG TPA: bifunctional folylpolyglutamate synthase/dihydrofolate synthase, partial [Thermoanaerobaculia bacterium]|nr:bifunctional folylpolyglutamate synthase/dihydrofolate synthase [Thermoanaerobaculia bacterium]
NPDGVTALARHLDEAGLSGRVDLVFGGLADKDLASMLALLLPRARRAVLTAPDSPRAEDPRDLAERIGRLDLPSAPLGRALELLDAAETPDAAPILVTGSLVLVGSALALVRAERAVSSQS